MSNPALDRAAQLVAGRRATGELAMLDGPEHHLVDEALKLAPELDPATIGAAWMMLGDILGRFATELPDAFPGSTLAILAQLAGQRLYTGTDVPREVPCPAVRSNGSPCPFSAKAVTPDLIDAQMRGHYATYHETLTWAPECGDEPSEFVAAIGFTQPCRLPRGHAEPCRHGQARPDVDGAARTAAAEPARIDDAVPDRATPHDWCTRYGFTIQRHTGWEVPGSPFLDEKISLPEFVMRLNASTWTTSPEGEARIQRDLVPLEQWAGGLTTAQGMRDEVAGGGGAIVKCERCTDPVAVREGGPTEGVLCQRCVAADGA